jgi:hypothetical protein
MTPERRLGTDGDSFRRRVERGALQMTFERRLVTDGDSFRRQVERGTLQRAAR